jgi:hypothetical protein
LVEDIIADLEFALVDLGVEFSRHFHGRVVYKGDGLVETHNVLGDAIFSYVPPSTSRVVFTLLLRPRHHLVISRTRRKIAHPWQRLHNSNTCETLLFRDRNTRW